MTRVAVIGASGRMGEALIDALARSDHLSLSAALTRPGHPDVGQRVPNTALRFRDDLAHALDEVDIAIDFASADGLQSRANACAATQTPWLLGTTGLTREQEATVVSTAKLVPVLFSANTSLAVNGFFDAVRQMAAVLGGDYDVDIIELHHRYKKDRPSGTALELGRAVARGWGVSLREVRVKPDLQGDRPRPSIAFSSIRAGAHAGEHRILFAGRDDTVELVHRASHRSVFANGALRAGAWLVGCPAGLYDMADFLAALRGA
jgi:4-hydroxy-tetrahydrodipicolinate reductase